MSNEILELKIDRDFKELIRPLFSEEYKQLEENLIADGCREPIIVWNGTIIDGHNRYEICTKRKIPFEIMEKQFASKEDAIIWICNNQLGRRNISEETRKYLIGKQYEATKINGYSLPDSLTCFMYPCRQAISRSFPRSPAPCKKKTSGYFFVSS